MNLQQVISNLITPKNFLLILFSSLFIISIDSAPIGHDHAQKQIAPLLNKCYSASDVSYIISTTDSLHDMPKTCRRQVKNLWFITSSPINEPRAMLSHQAWRARQIAHARERQLRVRDLKASLESALSTIPTADVAPVLASDRFLLEALIQVTETMQDCFCKRVRARGRPAGKDCLVTPAQESSALPTVVPVARVGRARQSLKRAKDDLRCKLESFKTAFL